jgi:hypothetical protein
MSAGQYAYFTDNIAIDRYVEEYGGGWRYRVKKSGYEDTYALP